MFVYNRIDETDFEAIKRLLKMYNSSIGHSLLHISNTEGILGKLKWMDCGNIFKVYNRQTLSCELIVSKDILKALTNILLKNNINILRWLPQNGISLEADESEYYT
jgi:hypothetical protein